MFAIASDTCPLAAHLEFSRNSHEYSMLIVLRSASAGPGINFKNDQHYAIQLAFIKSFSKYIKPSTSFIFPLTYYDRFLVVAVFFNFHVYVAFLLS